MSYKNTDTKILTEAYKLICERLETEDALKSLIKAAAEMDEAKLTDYVDNVQSALDPAQFKTVVTNIKKLAKAEVARSGENSGGILNLFKALVPTGALKPPSDDDHPSLDKWEDREDKRDREREEGGVFAGPGSLGASTIDDYLEREFGSLDEENNKYTNALKNLKHIRNIARSLKLKEDPNPERTPSNDVSFRSSIGDYKIYMAASWSSGNPDPSVHTSLQRDDFQPFTYPGEESPNRVKNKTFWDLRPTLIATELREYMHAASGSKA